MPEEKDLEKAGPAFTLAILSGPDDGAVFALDGDQVLMGSAPEAKVRIQYDPNVPPEGIQVYLQEKGVVFENRATGLKESRGFGEPYLAGQTWVAVFQVLGKEGASGSSK